MPKDGQTLEVSESGGSMFTSRGGGKHSLGCRLRFLRNRVFYKHYILRHAMTSYESLFGGNPKLNPNFLALIWRVLHRLARFVPGGERAFKFLIKLYFMARFLLGKVDVPHFNLVLTTKCTLRCEACNSRMQYFSKDTHYTCSFSEIRKTLEALFNAIDSVGYVTIMGGEPLLYKDLAQVVRYLRESPKVRTLVVATNGTLDFNEEVLEALEGTHKAKVHISDYSVSPNLGTPLRHESIIAALKKHNIGYHIISLADKKSPWIDPGRVYKRGRSKEDIIKNLCACEYPMQCVSVMSSEVAEDVNFAPAGAVFICQTSSSLAALKGLSEFEGDFIDLATATRERIVEFYAQDYFKACDYCHDMWEERRYVQPAVQTREVYRVEASS